MGQGSSQEIRDTSTINKTPEKQPEPPKLKVKPVPRPPSYAVPENKVLPTELPSKPLRTVSALSVSNPELNSLFVNKDDKLLENDNLNLDHNFFSDKRDDDNNSLNVNNVKNRRKYQAPRPPVSSDFTSDLNPHINAHRRTNSLDRLPVHGHQKRPISAVNLTSSEHTILEDPEDYKNNSLPQKNTFPLDYSYAVTYAQLAGHRRRQFQEKLNSEKELLLKQQSLPNLHESKMDSEMETFTLNGSEIDLDNNNSSKKKKYKAPPPPSASPQISKSSIILTSRPHNLIPKIDKPPEEPPVDYDTGEISTNKISLTNGFTNSDSKHVKASSKTLSKNIQIEEKEQCRRDNPLVIHLNQSPLLATSPKSPPPVKPKPVRSPDAGKFMFPSEPVGIESDVVTVNGYVIPESPTPTHSSKEMVSLSIDSLSERVAVAVLKQPENPSVTNTSTEANQRIIISDQPPIDSASIVSPLETVVPGTNSPTAVDNYKKIKTIEVTNTDAAKTTDLPEPVTKNEGIDTEVKSVPIGFTTDIFVDTSEVNGSKKSTLTQYASDSGEVLPLNNHSFESRTASDKSIEIDIPPSNVVHKIREISSPEHVNQSTMTMDLMTSLERSVSSSSSDSAKPVSPPLTPDTTSPHKMNNILQNDIMEAAQVRILKLKKPTTAEPPQKSPEDIFKEQLAKLHIEREERIHQHVNENPAACVNQNSPCAEKPHIDRSDNDSGIQACSFSEDWTPEHDLDIEDSDDEQRSVVTSRSGHFYEGMRHKSEIKASNSFRPNDFSNGHPKILRKSDSDASEKYKIGSLRRLKNNVHKSVQQAFNSKPSKKQSKLDKRSSLPVVSQSSPENKQPMFRKLDPESVYSPQESQQKQYLSENKSPENGSQHSEKDQQLSKKAGVAYVSGKGQIVLLPEFDSKKSDKNADDGHWAPKRWKKMKKFSYMATTRKKEKQKMEQLLQDRVAEQERRMEEERQKQLEMERKFMKVRQVDQSELEKISEQINQRKEMNLGSGASSRSTSLDESRDDYEHEDATINGNQQGTINPNNIQNPLMTGYPIPPLIQAQNIQMAANQAQLNSMLLTQNQPYNPWLHAQPMQNLRYPTSVGMGVPNYGAMQGQFPTSSLPYDINNYMQMLDINGQPVAIPVNGGFVNGYPWVTQSLDRRQVNGQVQYNTPNYSSTVPVHHTTMLTSNNYNNKRSLKQPGTIDDYVLNQMYDEYQNGTRHARTSTSAQEKKKRSNPLYYSSDEEEEYEVQDVHTGHRHSGGTVARISVPDHHPILSSSQHHSQDEEMPSPCSVTSSSADSGPTYSPSHLKTPQSFTRNQGSPDGLNLDESYSSADR